VRARRPALRAPSEARAGADRPRAPGAVGEAAVRRRYVDEFEQASASLEGDFADGPGAKPVTLPEPEMGALPELARVLGELSLYQRDRAAGQMLRGGYVRRLLDLFRVRLSLSPAQRRSAVSQQGKRRP
jgi:hypothetical protein